MEDAPWGAEEDGVPLCIFTLMQYLHAHAASTAELFQRDVGERRVGSMRETLVAENRVHEGVDPYEAAALLQTFFQGRPPLLTYERYEQFIACASEKDLPTMLENLSPLLCGLPQQHLRLLFALLAFFSQLTRNTAASGATAYTLGRKFGPLLLRPRVATVKHLRDLAYVARLVKVLINEYDALAARKTIQSIIHAAEALATAALGEGEHEVDEAMEEPRVVATPPHGGKGKKGKKGKGGGSAKGSKRRKREKSTPLRVNTSSGTSSGGGGSVSLFDMALAKRSKDSRLPSERKELKRKIDRALHRTGSTRSVLSAGSSSSSPAASPTGGKGGGGGKGARREKKDGRKGKGGGGGGGKRGGAGRTTPRRAAGGKRSSSTAASMSPLRLGTPPRTPSKAPSRAGVAAAIKALTGWLHGLPAAVSNERAWEVVHKMEVTAQKMAQRIPGLPALPSLDGVAGLAGRAPVLEPAVGGATLTLDVAPPAASPAAREKLAAFVETPTAAQAEEGLEGVDGGAPLRIRLPTDTTSGGEAFPETGETPRRTPAPLAVGGVVVEDEDEDDWGDVDLGGLALHRAVPGVVAGGAAGARARSTSQGPALIANLRSAQKVQQVGDMVYDPVKRTWINTGDAAHEELLDLDDLEVDEERDDETGGVKGGGHFHQVRKEFSLDDAQRAQFAACEQAHEAMGGWWRNEAHGGAADAMYDIRELSVVKMVHDANQAKLDRLLAFQREE